MTVEHVSQALSAAENWLVKAEHASNEVIAQHYRELADHELAQAKAFHEALKSSK